MADSTSNEGTDRMVVVVVVVVGHCGVDAAALLWVVGVGVGVGMVVGGVHVVSLVQKPMDGPVCRRLGEPHSTGTRCPHPAHDGSKTSPPTPDDPPTHPRLRHSPPHAGRRGGAAEC